MADLTLVPPHMDLRVPTRNQEAEEAGEIGEDRMAEEDRLYDNWVNEFPEFMPDDYDAVKIAGGRKSEPKGSELHARDRWLHDGGIFDEPPVYTDGSPVRERAERDTEIPGAYPLDQRPKPREMAPRKRGDLPIGDRTLFPPRMDLHVPTRDEEAEEAGAIGEERFHVEDRFRKDHLGSVVVKWPHSDDPAVQAETDSLIRKALSVGYTLEDLIPDESGYGLKGSDRLFSPEDVQRVYAENERPAPRHDVDTHAGWTGEPNNGNYPRMASDPQV